jgi:hypothetical protein
VSEGAVLGIVVELSLKLFVSLLNVDADTDGDEQKCACDDQNHNKRATLGVFGGGGRLVGLGGIARLIGDFPVVSIEADVLVLLVRVVQHHVVVGEKGVSDDISLLIGSLLTVDEEFASIIIQSLVKGSQVGQLPVNSIVILAHGQNVLSEVLSCLVIRFGSVEIKIDIKKLVSDIGALLV